MKKLNGRGKQSVKTLTNSRKNYSHHDYWKLWQKHRFGTCNLQETVHSLCQIIPLQQLVTKQV